MVLNKFNKFKLIFLRVGIKNITSFHGCVRAEKDIWLIYELGGKPLTK